MMKRMRSGGRRSSNVDGAIGGGLEPPGVAKERSRSQQRGGRRGSFDDDDNNHHRTTNNNNNNSFNNRSWMNSMQQPRRGGRVDLRGQDQHRDPPAAGEPKVAEPVIQLSERQKQMMAQRLERDRSVAAREQQQREHKQTKEFFRGQPSTTLSTATTKRSDSSSRQRLSSSRSNPTPSTMRSLASSTTTLSSEHLRYSPTSSASSGHPGADSAPSTVASFAEPMAAASKASDRSALPQDEQQQKALLRKLLKGASTSTAAMAASSFSSSATAQSRYNNNIHQRQQRGIDPSAAGAPTKDDEHSRASSKELLRKVLQKNRQKKTMSVDPAATESHEPGRSSKTKSTKTIGRSTSAARKETTTSKDSSSNQRNFANVTIQRGRSKSPISHVTLRRNASATANFAAGGDRGRSPANVTLRSGRSKSPLKIHQASSMKNLSRMGRSMSPFQGRSASARSLLRLGDDGEDEEVGGMNCEGLKRPVDDNTASTDSPKFGIRNRYETATHLKTFGITPKQQQPSTSTVVEASRSEKDRAMRDGEWISQDEECLETHVEDEGYRDFLNILQMEASGQHSQLWASFRALMKNEERPTDSKLSSLVTPPSSFRFDAETLNLLKKMNHHVKEMNAVEYVGVTQLVNDKTWLQEVKVSKKRQRSQSATVKLGELATFVTKESGDGGLNTSDAVLETRSNVSTSVVGRPAWMAESSVSGRRETLTVNTRGSEMDTGSTSGASDDDGDRYGGILAQESSSSASFPLNAEDAVIKIRSSATTSSSTSVSSSSSTSSWTMSSYGRREKQEVQVSKPGNSSLATETENAPEGEPINNALAQTSHNEGADSPTVSEGSGTAFEAHADPGLEVTLTQHQHRLIRDGSHQDQPTVTTMCSSSSSCSSSSASKKPVVDGVPSPWSEVKLRSVNVATDGSGNDNGLRETSSPAPAFTKVRLRSVPKGVSEDDSDVLESVTAISHSTAQPSDLLDGSDLMSEIRTASTGTTEETVTVSMSVTSLLTELNRLEEQESGLEVSSCAVSNNDDEKRVGKKIDEAVLICLKHDSEHPASANQEMRVIVGKKMIMMVQSEKGESQASVKWKLPRADVHSLSIDMATQEVTLQLVENSTKKVLSFNSSGDCLKFANAFYQMINTVPKKEAKAENDHVAQPETELVESLNKEEKTVLETYRRIRQHKPAEDALQETITLEGPRSKKSEPSLLTSHDKVAEKYRSMLRASVPLDAVKHEMTGDDVDPEVFAIVVAEAERPPQFVSTNQLPSSPVSTFSNSVTLSAEELRFAETYLKMLKLRIPAEAVRHKMTKDGVDTRIIEYVLDDQDQKSKSEPQVTKDALSAEEKESVGKYRKMLALKIPHDAVRHRMLKEGASAKIVSAVLGDAESTTEAKQLNKNVLAEKTLPKKNNSSALSDEEETIAAQFRTMIKRQIPKETVLTRMRNEGVSEKIIASVLGNQSIIRQHVESKDSKDVGASSNQLMQLHWIPLSGKELDNSVFSNDRINRNDSVSEPEGKDLSRMKSLFAKKQNVTSSKETKSNDESGGVKKAKLLDLTRSNNIAISLKAFKEFSNRELADIIAYIDPLRRLRGERVQFLRDLLPTASEAKTMGAYKGGDDTLVPAEIWFRHVVEIRRIETKVQVMRTIEMFESEVTSLKTTLALLADVCHQVMKSEKLLSVLRMVLFIGNIMNEGTRTGGASGFKFDSLLRLTQTKSLDGKLTVLDYMVADFVSKGQRATLMLFDDFPECQTASRILINELLNEVKSTEASIRQCRNELRDMKSDVSQKQPKPLNRPKRINGGSMGRMELLSAIKGGGMGLKKTQTDEATLEDSKSEGTSVPGPSLRKSLGDVGADKPKTDSPATGIKAGISRLTDFIAASEVTMLDLEVKKKEALEACKELSQYCGESGGHGAAPSLLGILTEFATKIEFSLKKYDQEQAAASRKMKSKATTTEKSQNGDSIVMMVHDFYKGASDQTREDFKKGKVYSNPTSKLKAIYEREQKLPLITSPRSAIRRLDIVSAIWEKEDAENKEDMQEVRSRFNAVNKGTKTDIEKKQPSSKVPAGSVANPIHIENLVEGTRPQNIPRNASSNEKDGDIIVPVAQENLLPIPAQQVVVVEETDANPVEAATKPIQLPEGRAGSVEEPIMVGNLLQKGKDWMDGGEDKGMETVFKDDVHQQKKLQAELQIGDPKRFPAGSEKKPILVENLAEGEEQPTTVKISGVKQMPKRPSSILGDTKARRSASTKLSVRFANPAGNDTLNGAPSQEGNRSYSCVDQTHTCPVSDATESCTRGVSEEKQFSGYRNMKASTEAPRNFLPSSSHNPVWKINSTGNVAMPQVIDSNGGAFVSEKSTGQDADGKPLLINEALNISVVRSRHIGGSGMKTSIDLMEETSRGKNEPISLYSNEADKYASGLLAQQSCEIKQVQTTSLEQLGMQVLHCEDLCEVISVRSEASLLSENEQPIVGLEATEGYPTSFNNATKAAEASAVQSSYKPTDLEKTSRDSSAGSQTLSWTTKNLSQIAVPVATTSMPRDEAGANEQEQRAVAIGGINDDDDDHGMLGRGSAMMSESGISFLGTSQGGQGDKLDDSARKDRKTEGIQLVNDMLDHLSKRSSVGMPKSRSPRESLQTAIFEGTGGASNGNMAEIDERTATMSSDQLKRGFQAVNDPITRSSVASGFSEGVAMKSNIVTEWPCKKQDDQPNETPIAIAEIISEPTGECLQTLQMEEDKSGSHQLSDAILLTDRQIKKSFGFGAISTAKSTPSLDGRSKEIASHTSGNESKRSGAPLQTEQMKEEQPETQQLSDAILQTGTQTKAICPEKLPNVDNKGNDITPHARAAESKRVDEQISTTAPMKDESKEKIMSASPLTEDSVKLRNSFDDATRGNPLLCLQTESKTSHEFEKTALSKQTDTLETQSSSDSQHSISSHSSLHTGEAEQEAETMVLSDQDSARPPNGPNNQTDDECLQQGSASDRGEVSACRILLTSEGTTHDDGGEVRDAEEGPEEIREHQKPACSIHLPTRVEDAVDEPVHVESPRGSPLIASKPRTKSLQLATVDHQGGNPEKVLVDTSESQERLRRRFSEADEVSSQDSSEDWSHFDISASARRLMEKRAGSTAVMAASIAMNEEPANRPSLEVAQKGPPLTKPEKNARRSLIQLARQKRMARNSVDGIPKEGTPVVFPEPHGETDEVLSSKARDEGNTVSAKESSFMRMARRKRQEKGSLTQQRSSGKESIAVEDETRTAPPTTLSTRVSLEGKPRQSENIENISSESTFAKLAKKKREERRSSTHGLPPSA